MSPENEKSRPGHARDREVVGRRVAVAREPVELAAARVAEPEQPRALVEGLAGGVVERRAEHVLVGVARGRRCSSVCPPLASRQRNGGSSGVRLEVERGDVPVEVVDRHERQPPRPGDRLRRGEPDEQRADQARALRDRDAVDVVERRARLRRAPRARRARSSSRCRRDATSGTTPPYRACRSACDATTFARISPSVGDERRRRLVARRLDPEDHAALANS